MALAVCLLPEERFDLLVLPLQNLYNRSRNVQYPRNIYLCCHLFVGKIGFLLVAGIVFSNSLAFHRQSALMSHFGML